MKYFSISEEELDTLMIVWNIATPSGYTSKRMKSIDNSIRNRVLICPKCECEVII